MFSKMMNYNDFLKNRELIEELEGLHDTKDRLNKALHYTEMAKYPEIEVVFSNNRQIINMGCCKEVFKAGISTMIESIEEEIKEKEKMFI